MHVVEPELLVAAVAPVIVAVALVGGATQGHPRHRLALAIVGVLSLIWVALLIALKAGSA